MNLGPAALNRFVFRNFKERLRNLSLKLSVTVSQVTYCIDCARLILLTTLYLNWSSYEWARPVLCLELSLQREYNSNTFTSEAE